MKAFPWSCVVLSVPMIALAADTALPDWAFLIPGVNAPAAPPPAATAQAQGRSEPGAPTIVTAGNGGEARACGTCHLPSGFGQPESANLAGLNADYFARQMGDFKSGARSGPRAGAMAAIARALTEDEVKDIAAYYAARKQMPWTRVMEAASVPKTVVASNSQRLKLPGDETEPLGKRIVEFRDSDNAGFVAFVPPGSLDRGKTLVTTGGTDNRTMECDGCHGDGLHGSDDIPAIAGRSPVYIARQLYSFKTGLRKGPFADVMHEVTAKLDDDDVIAAAAYVASLPPS